MSRIDCHTAPIQTEVDENVAFEPEGERIRKELIEFLDRNKIAGIYLDTELLTVDIQSAKIPPRIKNVLSRWGSIYVVDDAPEIEEVWNQPERPKDWDDNVVPPMIHPLSSVWKQPPLDMITISAHTAKMSRAAFDRLLEYSHSNPTGAYEGKMWKRHTVYATEDNKVTANIWQLCWFGYSIVGRGYVRNFSRVIVLTDGDLPK